MVLRVHGHIVSQPTRAVLSFLKANNITYEFIPVNPLRGEHLTPLFKALNPLCLIPAIEDGEFKLAESPAILTYIHTTRKCPDFWYPKDPAKRALVDRYLHWHHSNLRRGYLILFARLPGVKVADTAVSEAMAIFSKSMKTLEELLTHSVFLAGAEVSLADIVAFCELDQHITMRGMELNAYPKTQEWARKVAALSGIKEVHEELVGAVTGMKRSRRRPRL